jgi:histidinol-phosphate/aromatic aminotransferase/cobyric acid decarboxylase-like protein
MKDFLDNCRDYRNSVYKTIEGYTPGEQPGTDGWIKLNTNENPYPPSPRVREFIWAVSENSSILRKYPDPQTALTRRFLFFAGSFWVPAKRP